MAAAPPRTYDRFVRPLLVLLVLASPAVAQPADPKFEKGKQEDVKDVKDVTWTAKGEAGLVATSGNSKTTTFTVGASAVRKDKDNKFEATVAAAYAHATTRVATDLNGDGVIEPNELSTVTATSANNGQLKLRYDRYFTATDAAYVTAIAGYDRPAGKDFQGGGQAGYSRNVFHADGHDVLAEVGYDVSFIALSAGSSTTIHSGRLFAGYKAKVNKETALEASVEALANLNGITYGMRHASAFDDTRINALASATTSLSTRLSLSASFTAKFDNFPAPLAKIGDLPFAPGFEPSAEKLDTILKVSLIVKLL
jgi:hypothetical protein